MVGLGDDYSADVNLSNLTPTDQQVVLQIAPLAKAYGFDLHLAKAELSQFSTTSWGEEPPDGCRDDYDDMEAPDIDDLEFDDFVEFTRTVCDIVALDGKPRSFDRPLPEEFDLDTVFVSRKLEHSNPTKKLDTYEPGVRIDSLLIAYSNDVLVITPSENAANFFTGNLCPWACAKLLASESPAPTPKEAGLVQLLLEHLQSVKITSNDRVKAAEALQIAAERWNDVDLFVRTCRACGLKQCLEAVTVEGMVSACQAFGWAKLCSMYVFLSIFPYKH
ncbi:hypothetical protein CYLTODRAFT_359478 [Cylindrobasidium torrendii FP15055 ss-10]|uniref:Uncharacterized protein n=1 Tax=Cylindrobasidium torrendii FP15055 ss-10 TaxID=1314674 RepID=A0A0D7AZT6_9AGAR|nr:hypothetical protein CYLTODRAFT_359478 [Cylindrobasidium torrendii FP15055 ss-10]